MYDKLFIVILLYENQTPRITNESHALMYVVNFTWSYIHSWDKNFTKARMLHHAIAQLSIISLAHVHVTKHAFPRVKNLKL